MYSKSSVAEDTSLTPDDATDDSCITQFIEIVPLHISRKDFPNTVQVKDEFTADIKQEPEDLCEGYGSSVVNKLPVGICCTTNDGDWCENVDETQSHMQPAVVLERMNLTRLMKKYNIRLHTGSCTDVKSGADRTDVSLPFESKIDAHNNYITEQPRDSKARLHLGTVYNEGCLMEFDMEAVRTDKCLPFEIKIESDSKDFSEQSQDDKRRPYCCTVCDKQYTNKANLNRHERIHREQNTHSCAHCDKKFTSLHYLKAHVIIHIGKYKCTECGKCFRDNQRLTTHMRSHSGEKPFMCTVCYKRFATSTELDVHRRIHSGQKPYKCRTCDKAFTESGNLARHLRIHTGIKPYKCPLCDKSFRCSSHMQRHKCHVHNEQTGKQHVHNRLKLQSTANTVTRSNHCPYCGMQFPTNIQMKQHVSVCTNAPQYSCKHCSQYFARPQQLTRHLLKSHDEGTWFTCHFCQKKFCMKGDLKIHVRRHEGVKPYLCCECAKSFCTAGELRYHQMVHSNYRKFCCGNCGKYFKHKHSVAQHLDWCSKV